jgi:hypothetical protein
MNHIKQEYTVSKNWKVSECYRKRYTYLPLIFSRSGYRLLECDGTQFSREILSVLEEPFYHEDERKSILLRCSHLYLDGITSQKTVLQTVTALGVTYVNHIADKTEMGRSYVLFDK